MCGALPPELRKVGSMGSTLPEHLRFSPGTHKANNYLKDVSIAFQAISSLKIAQFINIFLYYLLHSVVMPYISKTLTLNYPTISGIYTKKLRNEKITNLCSRNASPLFSALIMRHS